MRTHRRRHVRALATAAVAAIVLASCGGDEPAAPASGDASAAAYALVSPGTLTVCSELPYAPFEFEAEDGSYTGFDIDMVDAVAQELGVELEVINQSFEGIQSGAVLEANTCDMAASAMTITPEREENLDFTDGYFDAEQSLLVKADGEIQSLADTAGSDVAVQAETTGAAYAAENAPDANLVEFSSGADAITALQAGQVVAVVQDLGPNAEAVSNDDQLVIAETFETGESYGFAVRQGREDGLLDDVNAALATLREDGRYDEIFGTYFQIEGQE